jgi:hypothetical protein
MRQKLDSNAGREELVRQIADDGKAFLEGKMDEFYKCERLLPDGYSLPLAERAALLNEAIALMASDEPYSVESMLGEAS